MIKKLYLFRNLRLQNYKKHEVTPKIKVHKKFTFLICEISDTNNKVSETQDKVIRLITIILQRIYIVVDLQSKVSFICKYNLKVSKQAPYSLYLVCLHFVRRPRTLCPDAWDRVSGASGHHVPTFWTNSGNIVNYS